MVAVSVPPGCLFPGIGAALIIARRPSTPTPADLALIRIGFLPLLGLAVPVVLLVWRLRGAA